MLPKKSKKKVGELLNQCCSLSEVGDTQRRQAMEDNAIESGSSQLGHSSIVVSNMLHNEGRDCGYFQQTSAVA